MKKILFGLLFFWGFEVYSQSNEVLDAFLVKEKADFASSVYLVLSASGIVPEDVPTPVAAQALVQKGWGLSVVNPERPLLWQEYSLLLMKSFALPGGLLYSSLGGTRYAVREINFLKLLPYDKGSLDEVTPYEALLSLQTLMEDLEAAK